MISLKKKEDCCGCFACYNICPSECITMQEDKEGFYYPSIDTTKCNRCNACLNTCPIKNNIHLSSDKTAEKISFAIYTNNDEIRNASSSGGVFSLLSLKLLSEGGIVYGASFDDTFSVFHKSIDDPSLLSMLQGSKYVQSNIKKSYKEIKELLQCGKKVLFSGTPCQVAALKCYLHREYDNLVTVDVVCHGVPSELLWKKYLNEKAKGKVRNVLFRDKKTGWKDYSLTIQSEKMFSVKHNYSSYMRAYIYGLSMRPSCYFCKFKGDNHCSDITIADFWGVEKVFPELCNVNGVNWVLVNNEKGKLLIDSIDNNMLNILPVNTNEVIKLNPSFSVSPSMPEQRQVFFNNINNSSFDDLVNNKLCKISLKSRIAYFLKTIFDLS